MTRRTSMNFWLDLVSLVVMIGLAMTGGLIHFVLPPGTGHSHTLFGLGRHDFGQVHFYLAAVAVVLLGVHVLLHWNWLCCVLAKALKRAAPSRRAQITGGLSLLFGVVLLLGGSLFWASTAIEHNTAERAGNAYRDHRMFGARMETSVTEGGEERGNAPKLSASSHGTSSTPERQRTHEKHLEDCPVGAAINGRTSFVEVARICGVSVEKLRRHLAVPRNVDHGEQLGRLKRRFGFAIHDVRRLACR